MPTTFLYRAIRGWTRMIIRPWYRTRILGGRFPAEDPCVLVLNHTNGLVDTYFMFGAGPRPVRMLAKFKLFAVPVLGWVVRGANAIPVYRKKDGVDTAKNADAFRAIHRALADGEVIAIFPEGESRFAPALRPLKTGAGRIALGAEAKADWALGVKVVPVGISYEDRNRFRSVAEGWVGEPFELRDLREMWEKDAVSAGRQATERIAEALREITLNVPDEEALALAEALERLMPPDGRPLFLRRQTAWEGLEALRAKDRAGHEKRVAAALALDRSLRESGLAAADLQADSTPPSAAGIAARSLASIAIAPLQLVIWGWPLLLGHTLGRRASTPEKFSTVKILVTFGALIFWIPALITLSLILIPAPWNLAAVGLLVLGTATLPHVGDLRQKLRRDRARRRLARDPERERGLRSALETVAQTISSHGASGDD